MNEKSGSEKPQQEPNKKPSEAPQREKFSTPLRESEHPKTTKGKKENNDEGEPIFREKE